MRNEIAKAIALLETASNIPNVPHMPRDVDDACRLAVKALRENERLRDILLLAMGDVPALCSTCGKKGDCATHTGSHKDCWRWQHVDKLKGSKV